MKYITLTLLLIFSTYTLAEKQTMTAAEQSQKAYQKWANDLNDYLIAHADADISIMGLFQKATMLSIQSKGNNQIELDEIAKALNDLVNNENLQPQSLLFAYDICTLDSIDELCDEKLIIEKLIQKDPQNLMVYIYDLNQAVGKKDQPEINSLINKMSNSTSSKLYFYLSKNLDEVINQYATTHPFDEGSFYQEIKTTKGFSDEMVKGMLDDPDKYQLLTVKISFKLTLPIPAFRTMIEGCKETTDLYKPCLKIAETMINKADTLIGIMIGYAIKIEVFKLSEMHSQAKEAEIAQELFRKEYQCINKATYASQYSMDYMFDLELFDIGSEVERSEGEYASDKKLAKLIYQKQLELGYEKAVDPASCFEH